MSNKAWIGVDLDGTLAEYSGWNDGKIGPPISRMVARVKRWISIGEHVKIMTARVATSAEIGIDSGEFATKEFIEEQRKLISDWCEKHIGTILEITHEKDFNMKELWDDRCVCVKRNSGTSVRWSSTGHVTIN